MSELHLPVDEKGGAAGTVSVLFCSLLTGQATVSPSPGVTQDASAGHARGVTPQRWRECGAHRCARQDGHRTRPRVASGLARTNRQPDRGPGASALPASACKRNGTLRAPVRLGREVRGPGENGPRAARPSLRTGARTGTGRSGGTRDCDVKVRARSGARRPVEG